MTFSDVELIAFDVEAWGEGWRFLYDPESRGQVARLARYDERNADLCVEIEIRRPLFAGEPYFVFVSTSLGRRDGRWERVSTSVRNPSTRRALEFINRRLDALEAATMTEPWGETER